MQEEFAIHSFPANFVCLQHFSAQLNLAKLRVKSLFLSFLPHFINHHEVKLRQIDQLAEGGLVPACTPLHTWISLITSLALPDHRQHSRLYVCVCKSVHVCVEGRRGFSWLLTLDCTRLSGFGGTHLLQFQLAVWLKQCLAQTPRAPSPTRRIAVQ